MINTISKTLEAQEKTQGIKQSSSTKIGTKLYAKSQRNELTEMTGRWTGRWRKVTGRSDQESRQTGVSSSDRTLDRTLVAKPTGRREAASDRVQRGSRAAKMRSDVSGGM